MSQSGDDARGGQTVDVEEIMARVRAEIEAKNGSGTATGTQLLAAGSSRPRHGLDEDIYRSLHQAKLMSGTVHVEYKVGYRTPVVGQAWAVVRRRIHQEIRIYIDALMRQQTNFNSHIARAVTSLVENLDALALRERLDAQRAQEEEMGQLRAQVAALQERLGALESRLAELEGRH